MNILKIGEDISNKELKKIFSNLSKDVSNKKSFISMSTV